MGWELSTTVTRTSFWSSTLNKTKRIQMNELTQFKGQLEDAIASITNYQAKQTKAESARIRKAIGDIKKDITPLRAILVAADKA